MDEEGVDTKTGKVVVKVDPRYFRPAEVEYVSHLGMNCDLCLSPFQVASGQSSKGRAHPRLEAQGRL